MANDDDVKDPLIITAESSAEQVKPAAKKRGRPAKKVPGKNDIKGIESAPASKKRGRPAKNTAASAADAAPKKRGRPAKAAASIKAADSAGTNTAPKKRGRPAKAAAEKVSVTPKKRGRPAKAAASALEKKTVVSKKRGRPAKIAASVKAAPKKRGRPAKIAAVKTDAAPKKRGRPAKAAAEKVSAAPKKRGRPAKAAASVPEKTTAAPKKRGRPAKNAAAPVKNTAAKTPLAGKKRGRKPKNAPAVIPAIEDSITFDQACRSAAKAVAEGKKPDAKDMDSIYRSRRDRVVSYLLLNGINAAVFEDAEERRDPNIRYLSGFAADGLLIITSDGKSTLVPWDENLAAQQAHVDEIVPYNNFERLNIRAVKETLSQLHDTGKLKIELPPATPYPLFLQYIDALANWDVRCRTGSVHEYVVRCRAVKDEYEIACTKKAAAITNRITDLIEQKLRAGELQTESDVALLIEAECRKDNCERTGFDTLAAGPSRSFAIHAFPGYTAGGWGTQGLSILDYGVVYEGYTSDATLTIARGPLTAAQEKILSLVQQAADESLKLYKKDIPFRTAASCTDAIFAKAKRVMPHTLGHGIGLEIHEFPRISAKQPQELLFKPGMIITLEPGLYDSKIGGCRLENDVLITEDGNEVITNSRIIRL